MIALLVLLPFAGAFLMMPAQKKNSRLRDAMMLGITAAVFLLSVYVFLEAEKGRAYTLSLPGICGMGLTLSTGGFSALYTLIVSFMWLVSALFSGQYFRHGRSMGRYAFFTLLTQSATIGVFLSSDLYTTFLFLKSCPCPHTPGWRMRRPGARSAQRGHTWPSRCWAAW